MADPIEFSTADSPTGAEAGPDLAQLQARVDDLEAANAELVSQLAATKPPERHRSRALLAVVLIVIGSLLAPVGMVAAWGRVVLTDTDAFVANYGPLINDPRVQAWITDEVTAAVESNVNVDALVGEAVDGLAGLAGRPAVRAAIQAIRPAAVDGVRSGIHSVVERVVASPAFAQAWTAGLRAAHQAATRTLQDDPNALFAITEAGLTLELGPLVSRVRAAMLADGYALASRIPEVNQSLLIVEDVSLSQVRFIDGLVLAAGYWLGPIVLLLLAGGVLVSVRRARATLWAAVGLAAGAGVVLSGTAIGLPLLQAVAQAVVPPAVLEVFYAATTTTLTDLATATLLLAILVGVGAWLLGPDASAKRVRSGFANAKRRLRKLGESVGISTGTFGEWLFAHRVLLRVVAGAAAIGFLAANRPLTPERVLGTATVTLLAILILEVLGRPQPVADGTGGEVHPAQPG